MPLESEDSVPEEMLDDFPPASFSQWAMATDSVGTVIWEPSQQPCTPIRKLVQESHKNTAHSTRFFAFISLPLPARNDTRRFSIVPFRESAIFKEALARRVDDSSGAHTVAGPSKRTSTTTTNGHGHSRPRPSARSNSRTDSTKGPAKEHENKFMALFENVNEKVWRNSEVKKKHIEKQRRQSESVEPERVHAERQREARKHLEKRVPRAARPSTSHAPDPVPDPVPRAVDKFPDTIIADTHADIIVADEPSGSFGSFFSQESDFLSSPLASKSSRPAELLIPRVSRQSSTSSAASEHTNTSASSHSRSRNTSFTTAHSRSSSSSTRPVPLAQPERDPPYPVPPVIAAPMSPIIPSPIPQAVRASQAVRSTPPPLGMRRYRTGPTKTLEAQLTTLPTKQKPFKSPLARPSAQQQQAPPRQPAIAPPQPVNVLPAQAQAPPKKVVRSRSASPDPADADMDADTSYDIPMDFDPDILDREMSPYD
ncbi:hypothetical protein K474DRAFT_1770474 [Panus rudis PR-1116 ss-1]|nr:hypothetical protein K474DRAFT_1770474 [Panus rudis PR-1116 ss-1]